MISAGFNRQVNRQRAGAALVEMAVVLPVFLMVVFGIVEFGRGMMALQIVTNASREAARSSIIAGSSNTAITAAAKTFLQNTLGVGAADVSVSITCVAASGNPDPGGEVGSCKTGDQITVQVSVPFNKVSFITGKYLAGKNLRAQTTMRHE